MKPGARLNSPPCERTFETFSVRTTGSLGLTVDGRVYLLGAGGSFFFNSSLPHSCRNVGTSEARVAWMNSHKARLTR